MLVLKKSRLLAAMATLSMPSSGCASSSDRGSWYLRAQSRARSWQFVVRTTRLVSTQPLSPTWRAMALVPRDQIELPLKNVFRDAGTPAQQVAVSSIKTQIGHLKACADAGLIKAILAIKHKTLPQSINCVEPPSLYHNGEDSKTDLAISDTPSTSTPRCARGLSPSRACHAVLAFHPSDSVVLTTTVSSRKPRPSTTMPTAHHEQPTLLSWPLVQLASFSLTVRPSLQSSVPARRHLQRTSTPSCF